ncbi:lysophospholipid acyltransferase family protein [Mucilaginibacter sp. RS28]|uniref:Lysophospholipid acyltransferase family protein n=1 Tax=Mucilaginibacter straminoryzae TaxID=2932774 RepID=A0A9X1X0G6_9SPHI|nr:lysophospholipid acyltransferase family protein [Mucilaginibacter straminoryzae]MCJ8208778.1 lysophospholipid acyltransferase family protein [Mucilaginibacter straminoryzae]
MIYPKKNRFILWFMEKYTDFALQQTFRQISYNHPELLPGKSVLLLANHFSYWDGLLLHHINKQVFKKNFHVMILEETAQKEVFLKYAGAFTVNKNSRDVIKSLDYAAALLSNPDNLVLIFPQGALHSNFVDEVAFEKGVFKIMERAQDSFQLLFAVTFIEYFQYKKPSAFVNLASAAEKFADIAALKNAFQKHYENAKLQQSKIVV